MNKEIPLKLKKLPKNEEDRALVERALALHAEAMALAEAEKFDESLERTVEALKEIRNFSDFSHTEFKALLATLLFDLSQVHFSLKDYKQSEKELETLFRVLENLLKEDSERFGPYHVLAMELSTRILRSRKKTLDLLAKQQINTGILYEKVNAGVAAATDKLVESLRKDAELMAQSGDYRGAVRYYMEAVKLAKKRTGRVGRREVRMTIDMARAMMHSRSERDRALRLLNAVLPHAVGLEILEMEQEILAMIQRIESGEGHDTLWKHFTDKLHRATRPLRRHSHDEEEKTEEES